MPIESRNPATGEIVERFDEMDDAGIDAAIGSSVRAHETLKGLSFGERARCMQRAADLLDERKDDYGRMLTGEMGKTLAAAIGEVEKCARVCRYYAENAERQLADRTVVTDASRAFVRYLPIGPVLAVMPWNFPFWQVFRFAAPALMAANTGLLKHASNVPRSALAIETVFHEAGFPDAAFQTLLIGAGKVERVLGDSRVRAATLTGSEGAGRSVAAMAGEQIKKTVLELGGSDAFLVMPSADLGEAVTTAVTARTINNGQSCIAAKRFIVHADIYDAFRDAFAERFEALTVGDPMDSATDIGPLATAAIRDELAAQVDKSVADGATRLVGAEIIDGPGYFYRPGVLADIPEDAPAYSEELFGPVASLFRVDSLDAGIRLANDSRFGLGSAIFTTDDAEIERAASELDAGATFVNSLVASDPRLPFGGVKASGYGRELSAEGIREFVNVKTVSIA
ncbi:MAG: NAD-dependent succinate-semialdehyde dehydrogenase [Pseudomonadota bacterium]